MISKIQSRHLKFVALCAAVALLPSALSYLVPRPVPIYENGRLTHPANFSAHDNGWPLPFFHNACFGPAHTCQNYLDWWGFVFNAAAWTVAVMLMWYVYKRVWHHHPAPSRRKK